MKMKTCIVALLMIVGSLTSAVGQPWVQPFVPVRELFVAPGAAGSGCCQTDPMSLQSAISNAQPGDLYWLMGGTYVGKFTFTRSGTNGNPIVYRGLFGQRATIDGKIVIVGSDNWLWGLEITDPDGSHARRVLSDFQNALVWFDTGSDRAHLINCLIHDGSEQGIAVWNLGDNHVVYGNTIFDNGIGDPQNNNHAIYTQNHLDDHGVKYFVHNNVLSADGFGFHAYTQGGHTDGLHLEENAFDSVRVLVGGRVPSFHNVVTGNYFNRGQMRLGYFRPSQATLTNNYFAEAPVEAVDFWCEDTGVGVPVTKPARNVFTGNTVVRINLFSSLVVIPHCFDGTNRVMDRPLDPIDSWDQNTYFGQAQFEAQLSGQPRVFVFGLANWRATTAANGNAFDQSSVEILGLPPNKIVVLPNDYETGRAHIVVYDWENKGTVTVGAPGVLSNGDSFRVHNVKGPFDSPILSGTYAGSLSLPMGGRQFAVFLVQVLPPDAPKVPTGLKIVP